MGDGAIHHLCRELGHDFTQPELLVQALTHPSAAKGRNVKGKGGMPYERLEFLGDRVLGLVVADMLFRRFSNEAEGDLAKRHAALVRRETLAEIAHQIGLPACLTLAKGENDAGGRTNPGILADACEAVIGAFYADAGFDKAAVFVRRLWMPLMDAARKPPKDAKTALQEWAQGRGKPLPNYTVVGQDGPPHDPVFVVAVNVEGVETTTGKGNSKRVAEQAAATAMLEKVEQ